MKTIKMALRQYWWAVLVILVAMAASLAVAGYLLVNQRLPLPWDDVYSVEAEFGSGQAVTPGQGQAVAVAGVSVGEISDVRIEGGRAIVTMRIERPKLDAIHDDATVMLRPRTGLQDMTIELDPGRKGRPTLDDGDRIPEAQTVSQVQLDEALDALDADSRAYFRQLLQATAEGFRGNNRQLQQLLRVATPTAEDAHEVLAVVRERRRNLQGVITRLRRVSDALVENDRAVGDTLDRAAVTFKALGDRDAELRRSLGLLPSTLQVTGDALLHAGRFADELGPASRALRPAIRDTTAVLPRVEPLLRGLPADLKPLRTLAVEGREPIRQLRSAVQTLQPLLKDLSYSALVLQHVVNVLGYEPPGDERGFAYYLAWFAHNANSVFSNQDAHGVTWRGQLILSCSSFTSEAAAKPIVEVFESLGLCG
ncbi:MAG: MlaD family protein [Solirubrobacteraceae bacterium]|nr:MlaD family protein [Solirubrobacteraceae bacterium]